MKKVNSNKEEEKKKGIRSMIILEIIGKPPEHLVKTLEDLIKSINEEKGVEVLDKKMHEPVLMKDSKEFYTTFAEVELEVEDILYLAIVMFKYMPAHIEVIEPELIALTNNGWTDILSELTRRLHGYEEVARFIRMENMKIKKKMSELLSENKEGKEVKKDVQDKESEDKENNQEVEKKKDKKSKNKK